MAFNDLNLIGFLKTKMTWHQERQQVLARNVANADTPGYEARDLEPLRFERHLEGPSVASVPAARTHKAHFTSAVANGTPDPNVKTGESWEITPEGNAVVLEEQMIKVSRNQFDYRLASSLYTRSLGLLRTALGRNG